MLRKTIYAMAGVLWLAGVATAADMPTKAPPKPSVFTNPFITYQGSGFYGFGGGFGGASIVDLSAAPGTATRLNAIGAGGGVGGGYMWGRGTTWMAVDLRLNYASTSVAAMCAGNIACGFKQNASVEVRAKYGSDSTVLSSFLPNLGLSSLFGVLPTVPVGVTTPSHPYLFAYGEAGRNKADIALVDQRRWGYEVGGGVGMIHQIGSKTALDTWAKCGLDTGGTNVAGATSLRLGSTCKGGMDLIF